MAGYVGPEEREKKKKKKKKVADRERVDQTSVSPPSPFFISVHTFFFLIFISSCCIKQSLFFGFLVFSFFCFFKLNYTQWGCHGQTHT